MNTPSPDAASAFAALMDRHRSIRAYKPAPRPERLVDTVLAQALQGNSSSRHLKLVSVVKTQDAERGWRCSPGS